jgi:cysteinyl-tRNA synthetase
LALAIYNTLARSKQPFVPLDPAIVRIYDCGPTVWAEQHIGNLYRYIVADVVRRTFEYLGYRVLQVMNITDVGAILGDVDEGEDRMTIAARREGLDPLAIAEKYTELFFRDEKRLNILRPHVVSKATDHIPEMQALIGRLLERGHAYVASDGVYFDVASWPDYGKLSRKRLDDLIAGARVEVNPNKRHPADFALWRGAKPDDLQRWASPWGEGKPGWHIECSAMSMKYLGDTFDIHSGGEDHIFPHHECEIAQAEAATGEPLAQVWMHVYFLLLGGEDMHKSKGNIHTVSDIVERGYDPLAFRLLALQSHYRSHLSFTWDNLAQQNERLDRWRWNIRRLCEQVGEGPLDERTEDLRTKFVEALEDDFNTAKALAAAEQALTRANATTDDGERAAILARIFDMDRVLGLSLRDAAVSTDTLTDEENDLLEERETARRERDWGRADAIRERLLQRGIQLHDEKTGPRWERVGPRK